MDIALIVVALIVGVVIGQLSVWRWLGVPLAKDGKEADEWVQFLKDCVHDRKLEQSWFD